MLKKNPLSTKITTLSVLCSQIVVVLCLLAAMQVQASSTIYELDLSKGETREVKSWLKAGGKSPDGTELGVNSLYWTRNGKPWIPVMGEFHFYRYPAAQWELELRKMKAGGISIVSSYVFWEAAENPRGNWNWTGDNDVRRFVLAAQKAGLYVWLRPGPYVNGEIKHTGIPEWAWKLKARTNNTDYLAAAKTYFAQLAEQVKGLWFKEGGPIIGCQLENEYAHGSKDHIASLKKIAEDVGFAPCFYSVTANSEYHYERGDIIPLQGAYPYRYWMVPGPTDDFLYIADEWGAMENLGKLYYDIDKFPRGMCELGGGCLNGYDWRFVVDPLVMEGSLQNILGRGMNLPGYYMYHGGTHKLGTNGDGLAQNFDYQAPIGEFGQLRPSYFTLKLIHHFLNDYGDILADKQPVRPENQVRDPKDVSRLRYAGRFKGDSGFLFMTTCQPYVEHGPMQNVQVEVKLSKESLKIPSKPITIPVNTSPIFPVNMDMNGTNLQYSTAQLLCKVMDSDNIPCFVFFAQNGILPEFQFSAKVNIETKAIVQKDRDVIRVQPIPSRQIAFKIKSADGRLANILVLSREDALHSWRLDFFGKSRLLLSESDLIPSADGGLELTSPQTTMNLAIFPKTKQKLSGIAPKKDGIFSTYKFVTQQTNITFTTTHLPAKKWSITVPEKLPDNVRDVIVKVSYVGSTAKLFADNKLYTDNRHLGIPWEFSLSRFIESNTKKLTATANPWDPKVSGISSEYAPKTQDENNGMIRTAVTIPEYVIHVR